MEITKENIHPQSYYLLIEPEGKSIGSIKGLVLPENMHQPMPMIGTIKECGPDVDAERYKIGDIIMFRRYSVDELEIEHQDTTKEKIYFVSTNKDEDIILAKIDHE